MTDTIPALRIIIASRIEGLRALFTSVMLVMCAFTVPQMSYAQKVIQVAAGGQHSLQLREDGTVWAWGSNASGQLGKDGIDTSEGPLLVVGLSGVAEIAAGYGHSLARTQDGRVWAWGYNGYGQLGDGTYRTRFAPVMVPGLRDVVEIRAGGNHSLVRSQDGRVWTWGYNGSGQLGTKAPTSRNIPDLLLPLGGIVEISAGESHSLARAADGRVFAWGDNSYGQLGVGNTLEQNGPVAITSLSGIAQLSAGGRHSLARGIDGKVFAWGYNGSGQLGDGTTVNRYSPIAVATLSASSEVRAGWIHSLSRTQSGEVWIWGVNWRGQGIGTREIVPIQVSALDGVLDISAGMLHSMARKKDGRVWAWGSNESGALGLGSIAARNLAGVVAGLANVTDVSAGSDYALARSGDGRVWSWGENYAGQLGSGDNVERNEPVLLPSLGGIVGVSVGDSHSLAFGADGRVWAWGWSYYGQLGIGANSGDRNLPTLVPNLASVAETGAGYAHSLARSQDGRVWAWGWNGSGQLGDGTTTNRSSPVQVPGLTGVVEISAGYDHSLARTQDGRVWAWGSNGAGQLGDGTSTNRSSPVPVFGLTGVVEIRAGKEHSLARTQDGRVWAWGYNYYGQLGDGTTTNRSSPVPVLGLTGVVEITAGGYRSVARTQDGGVWAWGKGFGTKPLDLFLLKQGSTAHLSVGNDHILALLTNGRIAAFGNNSSGQLGILGPQDSSVPKLVADVMQPVVNSGGYPVVEFENKSIEGGRYFITVQTDEIAALDILSAAQGSSGGFTRSGRAWRGWRTQAEATAGATGASFASSIKPVYRFYVPGPNSHFYTVSESERDLLINYNANLNPKVHQYEGAKFYAVQPNGSGATASCPSGSHPVYRAFNNKTASNQGNHRITSNWIDILRGVRFFGWTNEGIAFCSPNATIPGGDLQAYHTYPGDSVLSGSKMTAECVYNNAGPGTANGASLYCALPHQVNWTLKCSASQGAVCPAIGDNATNADGTLTQDNLRLGVDVASFPVGGIIHITATATAPDQSVELSFASATQEPGGAPDPNPNNNINGLISKTVVKKASDCIVSLSSNNLALLHNDTATRQLSLKSPAGCAWTLSLDGSASSMVSVSPTTGSGDGTLTLTGKSNASTQFRSGNLTATATTAASTNANRTAALLISQEAAPPVDSGCTTLTLTRENERQGPNIINASLGIRANTASCTWTMQSDQAWVVITQGANGKGSGNALYQIEANAGQSERKATLTIKGASGAPAQTLTIYQSSNATNLVNNGGTEGGVGDGGGDGGGAGGSGGEGGSAG